MFTVTTSMRGTSSLSIAPTQNTAPVHEYRCMFSHDLRKKKKTWHDGSVRYHTFNKRVMVYDDVKNFVGDLHYRIAEDFGEGTEVQLDKGILVQVEDRIGETHTDLAPLLDKRRLDDDGHASRALSGLPTSKLPRTMMAYSQDRPKSLAAVLGASHGRLGRARLPDRSPFEQKENPPALVAPEGRPAKRQRITADKENEPTPRNCTGRTGSTSVAKSSLGGELGRQKNDVVPKETFTRVPEVVELLSGEDTPRCMEGTPLFWPQDRSSVTRETHPVVANNESSALLRLQRASAKGWRQTANSSKAAASSRQTQVSADSTLPPKRSRPSGKTRLLFAAPKSRIRLMYRTLIPSSGGCSEATRKVASNASAIALLEKDAKVSRGNTDDFAENDVVAAEAVDVYDIDEFATAEVDALHRLPKPDTTHARSSIQDSSLVDSPLLEPSSCAEPTRASQPSETIIELVLPSQSRTLLPHLQSPKPLDVSSAHNSLSTADSGMFIAAEHLGALEPDKLTLLDQRLLMPPPLPIKVLSECLQASPKPRPFRRVLSEGDSEVNEQPCAAAVDGLRTAPDSGNAMQNLHPGSRTRFRSPAKLQRSISDTSALVSGLSAHNPGAGQADMEAENESGPWTTSEAYLLFEWWPLGRQKPSYTDANDQLDIGTRGLLRDEANFL